MHPVAIAFRVGACDGCLLISHAPVPKTQTSARLVAVERIRCRAGSNILCTSRCACFCLVNAESHRCVTKSHKACCILVREGARQCSSQCYSQSLCAGQRHWQFVGTTPSFLAPSNTQPAAAASNCVDLGALACSLLELLKLMK